MQPNGKHFIAEFISCSKKTLNDAEGIEKILSDGIGKCGLNLVDIHSHKFEPLGVTAIAIAGGSHIALHTYPEAGHASLDVFMYSPEAKPVPGLMRFIGRNLRAKTARFAEICRSGPLQVKHDDWITDLSTVGLSIRSHVKKRLLSRKSKYQQIDIIENENFGRMLFLNDEFQIAEKDASVYNDAMVSPLMKANSSLEKVLILGGGDGGIANELLSRGAKSITLVDIDRDVIEACKQFMPSVCGDAFRSRRVRVVIDDAYKFLAKKGDFDAIVYDLTMYPEAFIKIDREAYLGELLARMSKSLKKNGMVSLQCCPDFDAKALGMVRKLLSRHFSDVKFTTCFIPSFCVNWVFASAKAKARAQ